MAVLAATHIELSWGNFQSRIVQHLNPWLLGTVALNGLRRVANRSLAPAWWPFEGLKLNAWYSDANGTTIY